MKTLLHRALFAALLAGASCSFAQAPAQPPKILTKDELRTCMTTEADLGTRRQALEARALKLGEQQAAIRAESLALDEEQGKITAGETRRQEIFAKKVTAFNARLAEVNAAQDAYRADRDTHGKALAGYNASCGGVAFRPEDKEAILKEREAAK